MKRTVILIAAIFALLSLAPASADDAEVGCAPDDTPRHAITSIYYGPGLTPQVEDLAARARDASQAATYRDGGMSWRWTCELHEVVVAEPSNRWSDIRAAVLDALPVHGPRRYIVYAHVAPEKPSLCGVATTIEDEHGRGVAVHFTRCYQRDFGALVSLHELLHTFGIGHLPVYGDLMAAGFAAGRPCEERGLPSLTPAMDCQGDAYYNPRPSATSWLAQNPESNIANLPYLFPGKVDTEPMEYDERASIEPGVGRISGGDRYSTAVEISKSAYPSTANIVYVTNGGDFPDALAGSILASLTDGPVLLVRRDSIPDVTAAELERLIPRRIVILGGTGAVSAEVEHALARYAID